MGGFCLCFQNKNYFAVYVGRNLPYQYDRAMGPILIPPPAPKIVLKRRDGEKLYLLWGNLTTQEIRNKNEKPSLI